ncbi:hypothetical protein A2V71_00800 [Candidatus Berkelbacteria bacterium RBG_13_40_8]|uniref:Uncharacterized protein n=1 Tax=Candidatus Berkelbacteria bacterium RBG_13_40_8 TaxID=1797467 RepID=A0A1F5DQR8_9BACT|nr:MAG: hypothetical protein A2V71_00800 [Candidatus Berkelbacteria bacterium RBG_13_40_8]
MKTNKIKYHKGLTQERWNRFTFIEQMANIGSEVFRFLKWKKKDKKDAELAFDRALELLDLTLSDPENKKYSKEIARVRELLVDYTYDNEYQTTDKFLENYFYSFNYAARNL